MDFSKLLEAAQNVYMLFDMDGVCIFANNRARSLFCVPENLFDCKHNELLKIFENVVAHKKGVRFEYEFENKNYSVTADPCFENGNCTHILFCFVLQDTAHLQNAVFEFMSNTAHEIKRPLVIMGGYADTLAKSEAVCLDDRLKTACEVIKSESVRLAKLVDGMRELSKAQNSDFKIQTAPLHITYSLLSAKKLFVQNALSCGVRLVFNVQQKHVLAMFEDEARLHQLLTILFDNALKFTGIGGKIEIGIACGETVLNASDNGEAVAFSNADFDISTLSNKICVYVKDNGCGIDKENISKVFDRFFSYSQTSNKSSGIGLALAKTYMAAMDETVIVKSKAGEGAEFYLTMQKCQITEEIAADLKDLEPTIEKLLSE